MEGQSGVDEWRICDNSSQEGEFTPHDWWFMVHDGDDMATEDSGKGFQGHARGITILGLRTV